MAITVTDSTGQTIQGSGAVQESFRSYAYQRIDTCPALDECSTECGAEATTATDVYECLEDGVSVSSSLCQAGIGAAPTGETECCPAADPDACDAPVSTLQLSRPAAVPPTPPTPPTPTPTPTPPSEDDGEGFDLLLLIPIIGGSLCVLATGVIAFRECKKGGGDAKADPYLTDLETGQPPATLAVPGAPATGEKPTAEKRALLERQLTQVQEQKARTPRGGASPGRATTPQRPGRQTSRPSAVARSATPPRTASGAASPARTASNRSTTPVRSASRAASPARTASNRSTTPTGSRGRRQPPALPAARPTPPPTPQP
jgi:hypothetical protein